MSLTIKTNNVPRDLLDYFDLTEEEQREFDYIDDPTTDGYCRFFRYKGSVYDLNDGFGRIDTPGDLRDALAGWDGFQSDSFFSGIAVRFPTDDRGKPDFERVIVALVFS